MNKNIALLIIDVQNALFSIPNAPVYNSEKLISNIAELIQKARQSGTPVIYVQHSTPKGGFMEPHTPGWNICAAISPLEGDLVVEKKNPDSFQETILKEKLEKLGIQKLIITGLQTEFCIDTTCRRAYSLGYETILVSDGHSTINSKVLPAEKIVAHHNHVLGSWFCEVKPASEINFN